MKKVVCLVALVMLILPLAMAMTTNVNVQTLEDHKVFITAQDSGTFNVLDTVIVQSDAEGKVTVAIESGTDDEINIIVKVTNDGVKIALKKFEGQPNGIDAYYLVKEFQTEEDYKTEFLAVDEVVNETIANETVEDLVIGEEEEAVEEDSKLTGLFTGFVSSVGQKVFSKTSYYILGAIIVGLLVFIVIKKMPHLKASVGDVVKDIGEKDKGIDEKRIDDAEEKIAAAQAELTALRNKGKISAAEEKIKKEMEDLEKLKRGE